MFQIGEQHICAMLLEQFSEDNNMKNILWSQYRYREICRLRWGTAGNNISWRKIIKQNSTVFYHLKL